MFQKLSERLWRYIARKTAPWSALYLQAGAHCGLCGKWLSYEVVLKDYPWSICDDCEKGEFSLGKQSQISTFTK
jgi:hypothetical protein